MGQGHSTKRSQQPASKYGPREPTASASSSIKKKKRGGSAKSTSMGRSVTGRNSHREGERREAERVRPRPPPPPVAESQPVLPPHHSIHTYPTTLSPSSSSSHSHAKRTHERTAVPLPSRQFSLSKQTTSGPNTTGGNKNATSPASKHAMIEKYFDLYKDKEEDAILAEGMERFCIDLDVDPTEFIVLVLAWKFGASQMCRFTREEFMNGCQKMRAYDAKSLRNRFPELLQEARGGKNFKDLYQFTFSFGLDHSAGQRSLPTDMAVQLWELVFTQEKPVILERWFQFLRGNVTRGISRDTWQMFLDFCTNIEPDLSNYDESEAWPSLFDDFVECEQAK